MKNKIANDITSLIKEFTEKHCTKCNSYAFCAGEMVLSCKEFNKFLSQLHPPKGGCLTLLH